MIEHMNIIDTLSLQITALLDLMHCANDSADISSIRVASEMCLTMHGVVIPHLCLGLKPMLILKKILMK